MIQAPALELSSKAIEGVGGGVGVTTITTNPGGRVNLTGQKEKRNKNACLFFCHIFSDLLTNNNSLNPSCQWH